FGIGFALHGGAPQSQPLATATGTNMLTRMAAQAAGLGSWQIFIAISSSSDRYIISSLLDCQAYLSRLLAGRESGLSKAMSGICGIDEAGRGPWAGPVVAATVILPAKQLPKGLADSKQLSAQALEELAHASRACAIVGVGVASAEAIDQINILQATYLAMRRAFDGL